MTNRYVNEVMVRSRLAALEEIVGGHRFELEHSPNGFRIYEVDSKDIDKYSQVFFGRDSRECFDAINFAIRILELEEKIKEVKIPE
jgi:hypothetical protein